MCQSLEGKAGMKRFIFLDRLRKAGREIMRALGAGDFREGVFGAASDPSVSVGEVVLEDRNIFGIE